MSDIIAGDPADTKPSALGEFVGCSGNGCQRGEWIANAAERGWEQPVTNEWLCPQCAANAADRADFVSRQAIAWNETCPIGTKVIAYPGFRGQNGVETRTRSRAWTLGHGSPVVLVEGLGGGILLSHVDVISEAGESRG